MTIFINYVGLISKYEQVISKYISKRYHYVGLRYSGLRAVELNELTSGRCSFEVLMSQATLTMADQATLIMSDE